jgi:hypothetical protein
VVAYGIICSFDKSYSRFFDFQMDAPEEESLNTQIFGTPTSSDDDDGDADMSGSKMFGDCYLEVMKFDLEATKKKSDDYPRDAVIVSELIAKTSSFVHNTTIKFWKEMSRLALEKEIDAKIERDLIPKTITAATEAAAQVLDKIDLANPPKPLDNYIDKRIKAGQTKLQRELKNAQRLNCSGDAKNQESTPTGNGTSSKMARSKPSTSATATSKKGTKKKNGGKKATPSN